MLLKMPKIRKKFKINNPKLIKPRIKLMNLRKKLMMRKILQQRRNLKFKLSRTVNQQLRLLLKLQLQKRELIEMLRLLD